MLPSLLIFLPVIACGRLAGRPWETASRIPSRCTWSAEFSRAMRPPRGATSAPSGTTPLPWSGTLIQTAHGEKRWVSVISFQFNVLLKYTPPAKGFHHLALTKHLRHVMIHGGRHLCWFTGFYLEVKLNWTQIREKNEWHPGQELNPGPQDFMTGPKNGRPKYSY